MATKEELETELATLKAEEELIDLQDKVADKKKALKLKNNKFLKGLKGLGAGFQKLADNAAKNTKKSKGDIFGIKRT